MRLDTPIDRELGFWGELLTTALQAGATVYGTKQQTKLATAQLQQQIAVQKQDLDNQRRAMELQAQIAQAQAAAVQVPMPAVGTPATPRSYGVPAPAGGYDVQFQQPGALPSWALPAGIVGGSVLLLLLMRNR